MRNYTHRRIVAFPAPFVHWRSIGADPAPWFSRAAEGLTGARVARLRQLLGVDARTLERWRHWWHRAFAESPWWKAMRGRFAPPVPASALPRSLLQRFAGDGSEPLVALLRFVAPITTTSDGAGLFEGQRRPAEDAH